MFEVSFLDWLEKYGTVGTFIFILTAVAGTFWIWTLPKAYEGYRAKRGLATVCITPAIATVFFFGSLYATNRIVSGKNADLDRAASLVEGNWALPVHQRCELQVIVRVNRDAGLLTIRTADRFTFIYEIDAIGDNFVQAHPKGSVTPSLFERRGNRMIEIPFSGASRELIRC
jgi:amino acid transporter